MWISGIPHNIMFFRIITVDNYLFNELDIIYNFLNSSKSFFVLALTKA